MGRRRGYGREKRSGSLWIFILLVFGGLGGFIFMSKSFERNAPTIETAEYVYWNRKDPLQIKVSDESPLKSYEVEITDGSNKITVVNETLLQSMTEKTIEVPYPKKAVNGVMLDSKTKKLQLKVRVTDKSNWNFLQGNSVEKLINVQVDYKRPDINILSNSYSITKGGAALVVFQTKDDTALKSFFVEATGKLFKAQPYKQKGYYAALIAWPFNAEKFSASITAIDMAGNKRITKIPFYELDRKYRVSWIQAKDKFIDGKIADLIDSEPKFSTVDDRLDKLRTINETMRSENEVIINKLGKQVSLDMLQEWKIKKFYPLRNGAKVASFGDERHYYYKNKDQEVSQSYHLGLDLASTKMATILTSNAGKVVFDQYNGIYGNMPMIDHGLGLFTLYGHCSDVLVQEGQTVKAGDKIAKTGMSGLALGDHLHFGVLVQGHEVRPEEWMDTKWISDNIDKVFKEADTIIGSN